MATDRIKRYIWQGIGLAPDALVLSLRRTGDAAYAEMERDTENSIVSNSVKAYVDLATILLVAGHGQAYMLDA